MKKVLSLFVCILFANYVWSQGCQGNCIDGDGIYTFATGAIYDGTWKEGERSGFGRTISSNGEEYNGNYENDNRSGFGIYSFPSGEIYSGEWKDDLKQGLGKLLYQNGITKYVGSFQEGKINGIGKKVYYSGNSYEGEWVDGAHQGQGTYTWADGNQYVGNFENDQRHGQGTYIYADGTKYLGEFENGRFHGHGEIIYADGDQYVGNFENDQRHGFGEINYADGDQYVGNFENDQRHGQGNVFYADGDQYEGQWENDTHHGFGSAIYADGTKYEGNFENDQRHGQGKAIYIDGDQYEGHWENGVNHGQGTYIYADGTKYLGEFFSNDPTGKGIFTYSDGRMYAPISSDENLIEISSGSGFFVNDQGYLLTNNHVISICKKINTKIKGITHYADVINFDEINDLALLKIDINENAFISLSKSDAELGEEIMVAGFPLVEMLSGSVKVTMGNINALSGPSNNFSRIQFDAAVQPGNSGGPIINQYGELVGVIESMAKDQEIFEKTGQYPENVNFGIKLGPLKSLLSANKVMTKTNGWNVFASWKMFKKSLSSIDLGEIARQSTVQLQCLNTMEARQQISKTNKVNYLF